MASSKEEIVKRIKEQFVENSILQNIYGLTGVNTFDEEFSLTSLEASLIEVVATESKTIEDLLAAHILEVENRLQEKTPGTLDWYRRIALNFQYGDSLVWDTNSLRYRYDEDNLNKKIIKLASVTELDNKLIMKVAKLDSSGIPEPLEYLQLEAFRDAYMERVKYAGVLISYVSDTADDINLHLKVYYDPSVLNPDGSLVEDPSIYPINDAVKEYLYLTPFNGLFNVTDLIDKLQVATGVINPIFTSGEAKHGSSNYQSITDYYQPYSGYMKINTLTIDYVTL